jgi:hypothetical protein
MEKARCCLKCGALFKSAWIGNRICNRCKVSDANSLAPAVPAAVRKSMLRSTQEKFGSASWADNPIIPIRTTKQSKPGPG